MLLIAMRRNNGISISNDPLVILELMNGLSLCNYKRGYIGIDECTPPTTPMTVAPAKGETATAGAAC